MINYVPTFEQYIAEPVNESLTKPVKRKGVQTKIDPQLFDAIVPSIKGSIDYGNHPKDWTFDNFADFMREQDWKKFGKTKELVITLFDTPIDNLLRAIFPNGYAWGELTGANKDEYARFKIDNADKLPLGGLDWRAPLFDLWVQIKMDTFNDKGEKKALDAMIGRMEKNM